jgi:hypothetical protein
MEEISLTSSLTTAHVLQRLSHNFRPSSSKHPYDILSSGGSEFGQSVSILFKFKNFYNLLHARYLSCPHKRLLFNYYNNIGGTLLVAQLIEALRYKLEGRGFDSGWCNWNLSLT